MVFGAKIEEVTGHLRRQYNDKLYLCFTPNKIVEGSNQEKWGGRGREHVWWGGWLPAGFWWVKQKERDSLEEIDGDGGMKKTWTFKKYDLGRELDWSGLG